MSAFDLDNLSADLRVSYEDMKADGACALPCLYCYRGTSFNEFNELAEGGYSHEELVEILMSGTHPECYKLIFSGGEDDEP